MPINDIIKYAPSSFYRRYPIPRSVNTRPGGGGSSTSALTTPPPPIKIMLNGVYVRHHFDGGLRGGTGEFALYCIATDGSIVRVTTSKDMGMGNADGVQTGVKPYTWLDLNNVSILDATNRDPMSNSIAVGVRVIEQDDSESVKRILNEVSNIGGVAGAAISGNPVVGAAVGTVAQGVVNAANAIIDLDNNDLALGHVEGLHAHENYRVGRYIIFSGRENTAAIISVIPIGKSEEEFFLREVSLSSREFRKNTPVFEVKKEGQVSYLRKQLSRQSLIELVDVRNNRVVAKHLDSRGRAYKKGTFHRVAPGRYRLRVTKLLWARKGRLQYMYTAYGSINSGLAMRP